ncbi:MAG TPA: zinc-binding alcohol dehydrogenase family protein [Thermoleophilaceae bacterium]|jgi:NADPH:quinone reductase-like Zn-dependent oxidoreductase
MRAAMISQLGRPPAVAETSDPAPGPGETLVEVIASSLNPIDINVGAGRFFAGHPPLPYVPGCEAVGRVLSSGAVDPGTLVWVFGQRFGTAHNGGLADRAVAGDGDVTALPDGAPPAIAAALGIAGVAGWLPLSWRAPVRPDDRVLVLGATGTVGLVAVQTARLLGAGHVVAAGRSAQGLERALEAGAEACVSLEGQPVAEMARQFREAFGGQGPTYVVDPLWGEPVQAALEAAAPGARIVNLGQSAGPSAQLTSAAVRGKQLEIYGHLNFAVPRDVLGAAHRTLIDHADAGRLRIPIAQVDLDDIGAAWERQARGASEKLVVWVRER